MQMMHLFTILLPKSQLVIPIDQNKQTKQTKSILLYINNNELGLPVNATTTKTTAQTTEII